MNVWEADREEPWSFSANVLVYAPGGVGPFGPIPTVSLNEKYPLASTVGV